MDWSGVHYVGIDVVPELVAANRNAYGRNGLEFHALDALSDSLPEADLILVKDVLQHWTSAQIRGFLPTLLSYPLGLVTNDCGLTDAGTPAKGLNGDSFVDAYCRYRPVDISKAPFGVPATPMLRFTVGGSIKESLLTERRAGGRAGERR